MEHPSWPQPPNTPTDNHPFSPTTTTTTTTITTTPSPPSPATSTTIPTSTTISSPTQQHPNPTPHPHPHPPTTSPSPTTLSARLAAKNPAFHHKLHQMSLRLAPLVQLTTGRVHPSFPRTLLAFWLLTEPELDALAHFYHQRTPCAWTAQYPCPVSWAAGLVVEEKRRKLGRFIGLRGCETPVVVNNGGGLGDDDVDMMDVDGGVVEMVGRSEEEIVGRARRLGDEVEEFSRKMGWY